MNADSTYVSMRKLESPQNPVIKATAKLRTSRGRQKTGQIIIDGEREIRRAATSGVALQAIFLPSGNAHHEWSEMTDTVYQVSERAHQKIAFGGRLEPVAVATRPDTSLKAIRGAADSEQAAFIVLERVEKPGNIGAVLRSADSAGIAGLLLVDPLCDAYNPNAIRASLGTVFSVPVAQLTFTEFVEWADAHEVRSLLAVCDRSAEPYSKANYDGRVALVLGSEADGLSGNWGKIGNAGRVYIPMRGIADSLNVATAATLLMYEATKD